MGAGGTEGRASSCRLQELERQETRKGRSQRGDDAPYSFQMREERKC